MSAFSVVIDDGDEWYFGHGREIQIRDAKGDILFVGAETPEGIAASQLFAAAPDLLDALPDPNKLEALARHFDFQDKLKGNEGTEVQDDLRMWAAKARAAIAKAKGVSK